MQPNDTYLAVFLGSSDSTRWTGWKTMNEEERQAKEREGMAAWGAWMEEHRDAIVYEGGPLGKTKRASREGIAEVTNAMAVFIVVRAASHDAAVKMFQNHPHFTIFPGEAIEVMPLLPIPRP